MKGFKNPSFQDRANASADAKTRLLEKMKAAPKLSEEELAARAARAKEREAKEQAKRDAARAAREAKAAEEEAKAAEEAAAQAKKMASLPTAAELKAARDARYAARKARKN